MNRFTSLLILARSTPYASQSSRAALDVVLTAAAFELDVAVVFLDDGVTQLVTGQDTGPSDLKNLGKMIPALALYDVEKVYAHAPSLERLGIPLTSLIEDIEQIDDEALRAMTAGADQVLVY